MPFADVETASADYASRFSGKAGQWLLGVQSKGLLRLLGEGNGRTLLDVGGGHGQIASILCQHGWKVTVLGSEESALGQSKDLVNQGKIAFEVANLLKTGKADKSYDVVTSFRLLPHLDAWPELIAEMCRISKNSVVVDYPTSQSLNALSDLLFGLKKKIEKNTRTYTLFKHKQINTEFVKNGFGNAEQFSEFFLPMVIHRVLKQPLVSELLEFLPRILGLTYLWGSPIILKMSRNNES